MAKCLNLHCLETNVIEGIVQFDPAVSFLFVQHCVPESLTYITGHNYAVRTRLLRARCGCAGPIPIIVA